MGRGLVGMGRLCNLFSDRSDTVKALTAEGRADQTQSLLLTVLGHHLSL